MFAWGKSFARCQIMHDILEFKSLGTSGVFRLELPRFFGTWRSLVARLLWEQDVAGSNPVVPTIILRA